MAADPARIGNDVRQRGGIALGNLTQVALHARKEIAAAGHAVLDHFVEPRTEFPTGQRGEQIGIDDHHPRLMEGTDQVLAAGQVDTHLAANRGINLCQQRRRHMGQPDAPQVGGGREPCHVADHAAAKCHDGRRAVGLRPQQRVVDAGGRRQGLVALAIGHHDGFAVGERLAQRVAPAAPDQDWRPQTGAIRNARHPEADRGAPAGRPDQDRIRTGRSRNLDTKRFWHGGDTGRRIRDRLPSMVG